MSGVPANMLKHLRECSKISEEIHNENESEIHITQRSMESFVDKDILDKVHKKINNKIEKFVIDAKFLTLSGDGWTNISKQKIMFEAYKKVKMEFETNKWIGFVSNSEPDMVMAITHSNFLITNGRNVINAIENIEFWERLMMFYELLKPYNHIIMILESEQVTLKQVAATWIINSEKLLQIQEDAYFLFCMFYSDEDNNAFVDEWLNYQNKEGLFKAESINCLKLTKTPLKYWRTVLFYTSNLAEFACKLFSIPPNSATSERMAQITWYLRELFVNNLEKTQDFLKVHNGLIDNMEDGINNLIDDVNEIINNLEQTSARIIDDISIFDLNNDDNLQPPILLEIFITIN
ncbi:hypothetical protein C1645_833867 [Glomus cerebriforme]|uniref:HAT C-terminal dimerisation domain-containing protein n=1 Tax=Glomus cerebriforme TaxID=658196 RepID=A0A397SGR0_9GLOM|nr:hypothetical protein C1645_833867 [Glomus cerebriforme]